VGGGKLNHSGVRLKSVLKKRAGERRKGEKGEGGYGWREGEKSLRYFQMMSGGGEKAFISAARQKESNTILRASPKQGAKSQKRSDQRRERERWGEEEGVWLSSRW